MENQLEYYRHRAETETRLALEAKGSEARFVHRRMAAIYASLVERGQMITARDRPWVEMDNGRSGFTQT